MQRFSRVSAKAYAPAATTTAARACASAAQPKLATVSNPWTSRLVAATSPFARTMTRVGFSVDGCGRWMVSDKPQLVRLLTSDDDESTARNATQRALVSRLRKLAQPPPSLNGPRPSVQQVLEQRTSTALEQADGDRAVEVIQRFLDQGHAEAQMDARPVLPTRLIATVTQQIPDDQLSVDQRRIMDLACEGHLLFIGGRAGTGKTVLLRALYQRLAAKDLRVGLTAMTGVAAVHLGGCTFHHGMGVPVKGFKWDTKAVRALDVLVVDEVSMLSAGLLDALDQHARAARKSSAPFGGLQVILCGDFLQLTPDTETAQPCFDSPLMAHFLRAELVTPLRHRFDDTTFNILSALRIGRLPDELAQHVVPTAGHLPEHLDDAIRIFPKRQAAVDHNEACLSKVQGKETVFVPQPGDLYANGHFTTACCATFPVGTAGAKVSASDLHAALVAAASKGSPLDPNAAIAMLGNSSFTAERRYMLRLRHPSDLSQIMDETAWQAAATALVEGYGGTCTFEEGACKKLIPLTLVSQLSEAASAQSTQALRLKVGCRVMINRNLSSTVVNGSRGTIVEIAPPNYDLFPDPWAARAILARMPDKMRFAELPVIELEDKTKIQLPPIPFQIGGTAATFYYAQDMFLVPLQLGYAFTVHKVQGLTLESDVVVDCTDMFRCPHLIYVACSRVKSLAQLTIVGLKKQHVSVNERCLEFVSSLARADSPITPASTVATAEWARNRNAAMAVKAEDATGAKENTH
jgi:ATP-dependent DNA helicase PIF1